MISILIFLPKKIKFLSRNFWEGSGSPGVDPEDPLDEQQEEHDSDSSEVNPRRFGRLSESQIDDLISRWIQSAFARSDRRNDAYIQEVCGQMLLQDQRMASLEIQSTLNAGECQFFIVDFKYFFQCII